MSPNLHNTLSAPLYPSAHMNHKSSRAHLRWGVVLAGGEGTRMRPLIHSWLGAHYPKQYCTFVGSRSMFQHTVDRARSVVPKEHVLSIIGPGHRKFLAGSVDAAELGPVLEQPGNLGTAPGVFLPLAYVLADNLDATVILLPSDHFVHPEERFCGLMLDAFALAESFRDKIVLVGAVPDRAETEYGWIDPGRARTEGAPAAICRAMEVTRFQEKPDLEEARALLRQGCLWNTMIVAASAKTLWALGRLCLPEMMGNFDAFLTVLRAVRERRLDPCWESRALEALYSGMAPADFSKDILQHVSAQSMVLRMEGVDWCDWGNPQRVAESLSRLGRRPLFDFRHLASASAAMTCEGFA